MRDSHEPDADVVALMGRFKAAWETEDWDAYAAALAEDVVVVDHRPASLGHLEGRDEYIAATRVLRQMFHEVRSSVVEQHVVQRRGSVARTVVAGTDATDAEFQIEFLVLSTVRGEVIDRMEFFPTNQLELALRHAEQLRLDDRPSP